MVAGRCISSDRAANFALRVQASCMGMGQAAAVIAVLASRSGKTPAEVPLRDIRQLLREHGAIVPVIHPVMKKSANPLLDTEISTINLPIISLNTGER